MNASERAVAFVQQVVDAMGLALRASIEEDADGLRVNLDGEGGGLLTRRQGEGLAALQHLVSSAFRHEFDEQRRLVVDCMGYRRDKDGELRQMAKFLAEKARTHRASQEIGPLNPYERRIVHLAVSEIEGVSSESVGDAFEKTVVISVN